MLKVTAVEQITVNAITELERAVVKIILACVAELDFPVGSQKLINILRGSQSSFIREYKQNQKRTYSLLSNFSKTQLQYIINLLVWSGYLRIIELQKYSSPMPVLQMTGDGEKYLTNNAGPDISFIDTLMYEEMVEMNDFQLELFNEMRQIRRKKADEYEIPPYMVCSDKTLVEMVVKMPTTNEELLLVKGIGISFCGKYAESFLPALIKAAERKNNC